MTPDKMSNEMLMFTLSKLLNQQKQVNVEIKKVQEVIASREQIYAEKYRRGLIKQEQEGENG